MMNASTVRERKRLGKNNMCGVVRRPGAMHVSTTRRHYTDTSGTAKVTRGEDHFYVTENQSTYIPAGHKHRLSNPGVLDLVLISIVNAVGLLATGSLSSLSACAIGLIVVAISSRVKITTIATASRKPNGSR